MRHTKGVHRVQVLANHVRPKCMASSRGTVQPTGAAGTFLSHASSFLAGKVEESDAHAGDFIAQCLSAHGVKFVFCLSGGHISPILVGAESHGIKVVDVRHEVNAVFAADAVSRLTGVPGVAAVTAGPGVTNTVTALKNASMAQSPLVLLGGAAPLATKGQGALQDIDQVSIIAPIVKRCWLVKAVRDIVPSLREAFQESMSGVPGPVFVELPLDILYSYMFIASNAGLYKQLNAADLKEQEKSRVVVPREHASLSREQFISSRKPKDLVYLKPATQPNALFYYGANAMLRHRFAEARVTPDFSPLPVNVPLCPQRDIAKAASFLRAAKRPVLVLGSQSTVCATRVNELADAVGVLGIPTFLGGMSRGLLGRNGQYQVRQNRGFALKQADFVLLAGSVVDFRMGYGSTLPRGGAKIVAVNRSREQLQLNTGLLSIGGWKPSLQSEGDPLSFLLALAELCPGKGRFDAWTSELKHKEAETEAGNAAKAKASALGHKRHDGKNLINPLDLLMKFEDDLPTDSILIGDGGDFVATAAYIVRPRGPLRWLDPGAYGTLGVGAGFALGAKLVHPEAEVWLLWGDGAAGYSIAEFDTFARFGLNVMALVGNDAMWGQIERDQTNWFGSPVSCELDYTPYEAVATGYGGIGLSVTDGDKVLETLQCARQRARDTGKPVLINALIGRSDFREGSISA